MPQADVLSFQSTMLVLPVTFLGGYFFFATHWAPRVILTLRARAWLTRWGVLAGGLTPSEGWPEIFLMFVQFGGLLFFVAGLSLVGSPVEGLSPLKWSPRVVPSTGSLGVENFFSLWAAQRENFLFRPAAVELTRLVDSLLGGFRFYSPGKQFPALAGRVREKFNHLSDPAGLPND